MPPGMPAGYSVDIFNHPGIKVLMQRMADILRRDPFDFDYLMEEAGKSFRVDLGRGADTFTELLNASRAQAGLLPLVSAEMNGEPAVTLAESDKRVEAAIAEALQRHAQGEAARIEERVRIALEAAESRRGQPPEPVVHDDPPPPRGATARRVTGR